MTGPTPEAYEAAFRAVDAEDYQAAQCAVDAVWPIAEATVRAKVAAEIEQAILNAPRPNRVFDTPGIVIAARVVREYAARHVPPKLCANCGRPVLIRPGTSRWTHDGESGWAGVRCPGAITGARIAEGSTDGPD